MRTLVKFQGFDEEMRERFNNGWIEAGGYIDDCVDGNPTPWCCPWDYEMNIKALPGTTPEEWGAAWWEINKEEIEELLEEDEKLEKEQERFNRAWYGLPDDEDDDDSEDEEED